MSLLIKPLAGLVCFVVLDWVCKTPREKRLGILFFLSFSAAVDGVKIAWFMLLGVCLYSLLNPHRDTN